jgi:hypothetical protein
MKEKYDYQKMRREVADDEQIYRMKPVLLTQREIQELLAKREYEKERRVMS